MLALNASYQVALCITLCKKQLHTIAEELILPKASSMWAHFGLMNTQKQIAILHSDTTALQIGERTSDMTE